MVYVLKGLVIAVTRDHRNPDGPIREVIRPSDYEYWEDSLIASLAKGKIICEVCHIKPATKTLPRGPKNEGHVNVCDECAAKLYREG